MDPIGLQQSLLLRDQNPLVMSSSGSSSVPGTPPPTGMIVTSGTTVGISTASSSGPGSAGGTVNALKSAVAGSGGSNSNANAFLNREEVRVYVCIQW